MENDSYFQTFRRSCTVYDYHFEVGVRIFITFISVFPESLQAPFFSVVTLSPNCDEPYL